MKRLLLIALATIVAVSMIFGSTFCVSAVGKFDSEWGTAEEGIIPPLNYGQDYAGYYENCPGTTGFPNGDFEQGLKYWTTPRTKNHPADTVDIIEENGNHFMRFSCDVAWQGIESLRFVDSRVKAGDNLAILYKWRSDDPNFQIVLQQYRMEPPHIGDIKRVSAGKGVNLVEAKTDGEWNVSITATKSGDDPRIGIVQPPQNESKTIYLTYMLQVASDPTTVADIDDLSLVLYNENTGKVTDLDGKELYDVNNLQNDVEDEIDSSDFDNIDFNAENQEIKDELSDETVGATKASKGKITIAGGIVWIIIGVVAGSIVLVAAVVVVVVILVVKKKKATVAAEDAEDISAEETAEDSAESIEE